MRARIPSVMLIAGLWVWATAAWAQDAVDGPLGTKARAFVEADGVIFVGQLIRVFVEITTPTWFATAPAYPELRLDGAIVLMPEQLGINFSDRAGGDTVTGQRQRYVVIPQRAGRFEVPAITVPLAVAQDGKPTEPFSVTTSPLAFEAILPPEAAGITPLVTTTSLRVAERYERSLEKLKVGDAITRTVTIRASDTFGLALPPIRFAEIEGLAAYPAQPRIEDKVNRGRYTTERTDAATYILQEPGEYVLPEITVSWWDPESRTLESATLDEQPISVAANPALGQPEITAPPEGKSPVERLRDFGEAALDWARENIIWLTVLGGGFVLLRLLWRRFGPPLIDAWRKRRAEALQSEQHYFAEFRRACLSGSSERMIQAFWRWMNRLAPGDETPELKRLVDQAGDAGFAEVVRRLGHERYSKGAPGTTPRGLDTYHQVSGFRRRLRQQRGREPAVAGRSLNPRASPS